MADADAALSTGLLGTESAVTDRILAAAECCFSGAGYSATSMREIAAMARVSKSLLHYHFQSKEHLFLEVLVRIYNRLAARIAGAAARAPAPERALQALDALFEALHENPDFPVQARVWAASLANEPLRAHAVRMREHLRARLVETMGAVLGPAAAALPMSVEAASDLLWATVSGLGLLASSDASPERARRAFQGLRRMVAMALEAASPPPAGPRRGGGGRGDP